MAHCDVDWGFGMYEGDSFFTLSIGGQVGLACLSVVLTAVVLKIGWRIMSGRREVVRFGIAVVLFVGFVWLSPQVYYAYYRMIIEGLPAQWVIGWPPVGEAARKAGFAGSANLSAHGQGVLFWLLVVMASRGSGRCGQPR